MAFQVSPGVNVSEIDTSQVIAPPSSSVGGIAGNFEWGPALEIVQITSEKQLKEVFGRPTDDTANTFFTAASFLAYSSDLRVVRLFENTSNNATNLGGLGSNLAIKNKEHYNTTNYYENDAVVGNFSAARYPGTLGNGLRVEIFANTKEDWATTSWAYKGFFDRAPGTSNYVKTKLGNTVANDEMHMVVIDGLGKFSGQANTILEKYVGLSKAKGVKDENGESNWWRDVILRKSEYVYAIGIPALTTTASFLTWDQQVANSTMVFSGTSSTTASGIISANLSGGLLATASSGQITTAYNLFLTDDLGTDVSLLMAGGDQANTIPAIVIAIADNRKDMMAFISPDRANVVGATTTTGIVNFRNNTLANLSSSYAVMDSGWKYMYDRYNDVYRYVPLNGDIAGLCARTDLERDPWYSPAGLARGQIKNVVKLAFNPTKVQRDVLYQNGINPVVSASGDGTILFGDKTMQSFASAFDRINVRRLFIVLEKAIARAARTSLFEFNDEFTRAQFVNLVEPFLRTVQGRRGIYDFRVVCDESNNTADVIDRTEFVGDIYIKPARSINFIQLNFVAVSTGVSFEEVVGSF